MEFQMALKPVAYSRMAWIAPGLLLDYPPAPLAAFRNQGSSTVNKAAAAAASEADSVS
jgi:hypothetical protein